MSDAPKEVWIDDEIEEAIEYLKHGTPWEYGGAALGHIKTLEQRIAELEAALNRAVDAVNDLEEVVYWERDAGPSGPDVYTVDDFLREADDEVDYGTPS